MAESPVTMGAAGPNLFSEECYDDVRGVVGKDPLSIVQGARAYSQAQRLVRLQPSDTVKEVSFCGNLFPIYANKRYLQGGWVRAPGNVWHGRYFYNGDQKHMSWGYSMPAVRNTPEWTFGVQLLVPDKDRTGFRRKQGRVYEMALKQWTFPPEAGYMSVFLGAFGPGEAGDFWVVEITPESQNSSSLTK